MEHVELFCRITAGVQQDCLLAARVVRQERSHIEDLAIDNDPAVILLVVLLHLLNSESLLS